MNSNNEYHNKEVLRRLEGLLKKAKIKDIDRSVYYTAHLLRNEIIKNKLRGQVLNARSGKLIGGFYVHRNGHLRYVLGNNVVYAAIHEFGGTIYPKKAKWLRFQYKGEWHTVEEVNIPERSYIRSTIKDRWDFILDKTADHLWRLINNEY